MSIVLDRATQPTLVEPGTRPWQSSVFRIGGIAALGGAVLTPISIGLFAAAPPPGYDEGAKAWFEHIQDNPLLGLAALDVPFLLVTILMVGVMLALALSLYEVSPVHILIGAVLYLIAVATYFGTNTSLEMLSLSHRYAEAATEAQRTALLGAGEATLSAYTGTAFHINYILAQAAGIIFGFVMLRSHLFSRRIAHLMIGGNAFGYLLYIPEYGLALSAFSGVILWVWMISVGRRLLQLARYGS